MVYRIEYGLLSRRRQRRLPLRLIALTGLFFALFLLGVKVLWPEGRAALYDLLLPAGESGRFLEASRIFLSDLKDGEPFYRSLTAFCREIIAYANLPAA